MQAHPQNNQYFFFQGSYRAGRALIDYPVVVALAPQRAVGELGSETSIASGDMGAGKPGCERFSLRFLLRLSRGELPAEYFFEGRSDRTSFAHFLRGD